MFRLRNIANIHSFQGMIMFFLRNSAYVCIVSFPTWNRPKRAALEFTRKNHVFCLKTLNEDSISKANTVQRNHTEAHVKGTGTGYCLSETGSLVCRNTALLKQTLQLVDECCLLLLERLLSFRTDIYVGQNLNLVQWWPIFRREGLVASAGK